MSLKPGVRKNSSANSSSTSPNSSKAGQGAKAGVPLFLQRTINHATNKQHHSTDVDINHIKHNGSPLPKSIREEYESQLDADLSSVRIHSDSNHQQLASSLNAKAFTNGNDIIFADGQFSPHTREGKKLLAHELTHVVQQTKHHAITNNGTSDVQIDAVDSQQEKQADSVAESIVNNRESESKQKTSSKISPLSASACGGTTIQRQENEEKQNGIDIGIIPPEFALRLNPFWLNATTSTGQIGMDMFGGSLSAGYNWGDPHANPPLFGDFRSRYGADAPQGNFFLSGEYGGFNAGIGTNFQNSFNMGVGFGAPLLPMPNVLSAEAGAVWPSALGVAGAIPNFAEDPLGAYNMQKPNISALSNFGSTAGDIYGQQQEGGLQLGANAQLMYDPERKVWVSVGMQGVF